jgi:LacI family transcriptional regulator
MMDFDVNRMPPERKLARLADVAERAGVSTATADRVLNRRPGVRASTAQKVFKAAIELDYLPELEVRAAAAP